MVEGVPGQHEEDGHNHRWNDRPDHLQSVVAVDLGGQFRLVRLPPVAEDAPDDQPFHEEEDGNRDDEHDLIQVRDLAALRRDGLRCASSNQDGERGQEQQRHARPPDPDVGHRVSSTEVGGRFTLEDGNRRWSRGRTGMLGGPNRRP